MKGRSHRIPPRSGKDRSRKFIKKEVPDPEKKPSSGFDVSVARAESRIARTENRRRRAERRREKGISRKKDIFRVSFGFNVNITFTGKEARQVRDLFNRAAKIVRKFYNRREERSRLEPFVNEFFRRFDTTVLENRILEQALRDWKEETWMPGIERGEKLPFKEWLGRRVRGLEGNLNNFSSSLGMEIELRCLKRVYGREPD